MDTNESLRFHRRALESPNVDDWYKIGLYNNMGETYRFLGDVKSSLMMNRKALESKSERLEFDIFVVQGQAYAV